MFYGDYRSALKKIYEKDDTPMKTMVLVVSLIPSGSGPQMAASVFAEDPNGKPTPKQSSVEKSVSNQKNPIFRMVK